MHSAPTRPRPNAVQRYCWQTRFLTMLSPLRRQNRRCGAVTPHSGPQMAWLRSLLPHRRSFATSILQRSSREGAKARRVRSRTRKTLRLCVKTSAFFAGDWCEAASSLVERGCPHRWQRAREVDDGRWLHGMVGCGDGKTQCLLFRSRTRCLSDHPQMTQMSTSASASSASSADTIEPSWDVASALLHNQHPPQIVTFIL